MSLGMSLNVRSCGIGTQTFPVALGGNDNLIILSPPEKETTSNGSPKKGSDDCCMIGSVTSQ